MINEIIERLGMASIMLPNSKEHYEHPQDGKYVEEVVLLEDAIQIIKEESESNGWIPVSDRLPKPQENGDKDYSDDVHICMSNYMVTDAWYCFSDEKWYKQGNCILIGKVIAWQPLPEPYTDK